MGYTILQYMPMGNLLSSIIFIMYGLHYIAQNPLAFPHPHTEPALKKLFENFYCRRWARKAY